MSSTEPSRPSSGGSAAGSSPRGSTVEVGMAFKPEEVSAVLEQEIEKYESRLEMESVGTVLQVGDGIARVWGLDDAMSGEMVLFPGDVTGVVLNLEEDNVGCALFGSPEGCKRGDGVWG